MLLTFLGLGLFGLGMWGWKKSRVATRPWGGRKADFRRTSLYYEQHKRKGGQTMIRPERIDVLGYGVLCFAFAFFGFMVMYTWVR